MIKGKSQNNTKMEDIQGRKKEEGKLSKDV